jgi:hypothetical protein
VVKLDQENFETLFARFIEGIGGEILAAGPEETADLLFRAENIVVELKTLQRDSRDEHARKLSLLMATWAKRGLLWVIGRTVVNLRNVHPQARREWLNLLEAPIEGIIRKASAHYWVLGRGEPSKRIPVCTANAGGDCAQFWAHHQTLPIATE